MKKISQEIDDLLVGYLDGTLTPEKLDKVKSGLASSESLRVRLEALKVIQQTMQNREIMHPSPNFTQRVMGNLHNLPPTSVLTPKNGLLLLSGVLVAIGIGATLVDAGTFNSLNGILSLNQFKTPMGITVPELPSIPFNGKLFVNSIIAINLGLAFLLLDRTILRPFFNKRSRIQF